MIFAVILQFYGSKLVIFSESNTDVLLNTLAAFFLAEIDDYCYQFMSSPQLKNIIEDDEKFPPMYISDASDDLDDSEEEEARSKCMTCCTVWTMFSKGCGIMCGPCCQTGVIMLSTFGCWSYWMDVLGYNTEEWTVMTNQTDVFVYPKGFL